MDLPALGLIAGFDIAFGIAAAARSPTVLATSWFPTIKARRGQACCGGVAMMKNDSVKRLWVQIPGLSKFFTNIIFLNLLAIIV